MKKQILTLSIAMSLTAISFAQITLNRNHLIVSGQVLTQATDTNGFKFQNPGTNKTWDFSTLKTNITESIRFGNAEWYPGHSNFPSANLASINSSDDSSFTYLKLDTSALSLVGNYATIDGNIEISDFKNTIITFPSTYASNFAESVFMPLNQFYFGQDLDSTGPYPFIDSIRLKLEFNTTSSIDGWGKAITPIGTYDALLQTTRNINRVRVEMKTSGIWASVPRPLLGALNLGSLSADTSYQVQFWTNDASVGFPLISYSYSSPNDSTTSEVNWLKTKPQQSNLTRIQNSSNALAFPNPFQNSITVILTTNETAKIYVYDMSGKKLIDQAVKNNETIDMSGFSRGIYTFKIIDITTGTVLQSQKMIKN